MRNQLIILKPIEESVALVTLNRPEKSNALTCLMMEEICQVFEKLQEDSFRVVIVNALGKKFCSGLDLKEVADLTLAEKSAQAFFRMLSNIYLSSLITIAAVQGDAIAGGAGIALACDFMIMTKESRMGFPEVRRGLVAAQVSSVLYRQVNSRVARELLFLGELIGSERAVALGLANRIVEENVLLSTCLDFANITLKGGPNAIQETKQLLQNLGSSRFIDDLKVALPFHERSRSSEEAKEGISAFLEKRNPYWDSSL